MSAAPVFAEGITIPNTSFNFKAEALPTTLGAPKAEIKDISYTNAEVNNDNFKNGKYTVTKKSEIKFGTFPHAGEYNYRVSETTDTDNKMTYSKTNYLLRVYVANGNGNETYIQNVTAQDVETGKKPDKVLFANTYRKNGGEDRDDGTKDSLVIKKETVGDLADKTKKFTFRVTFKKSATAQDSDKELTGTIDSETLTFKYDQATTFKLSDGQELKFVKIPAGARYEVTEVGEADGYTPRVNVVENGVTRRDASKEIRKDEDSLSSAETGKTNLIVEKENKVTFVNTYNDVPVTGIIANNMPMILVAGFRVLAMLGYTFTKRKFAKR